jgi:peptide/nickel transport system substrate-binding protein
LFVFGLLEAGNERLGDWWDLTIPNARFLFNRAFNMIDADDVRIGDRIVFQNVGGRAHIRWSSNNSDDLSDLPADFVAATSSVTDVVDVSDDGSGNFSLPGTPGMEQINAPIPSSTVRLANLQAGSLDLVEYIVPTDAPAVQRDPKLKLAVGDALGYMGITVNTDHGPASQTILGRNALVRQALESSIDRRTLLQVVYNGMYAPVAQANPPSSPFYVARIEPPPRDIAKARLLLTQAGVTAPVPVVLTVPNNPDLQQAGEVIQAMAREAGFDVSIKATEFASSLQAARTGAFEAYLIYFSGRADADGNTWAFLHTGGEANWGRYSNPVADELLDNARVVTAPDERREVYAKLWDQERKDLPIVYLWTLKNIVGMRQNVIGFRQVPDGLIRPQGIEILP